MAKGYQANKERQELIGSFGKTIGKRAGFRCEWCEGSDDLRVWDQRPDREPEAENLALLCGRCRELADGRRGDENELRPLRNALWSPVPAVAEGVARVLLAGKVAWAREAVEESLIDEAVKNELLK